MNKTTNEREVLKAKNPPGAVSPLPNASVIINMLEHMGFTVAAGYQPELAPVLEAQVNHELETIFPHHNEHEVLKKVRRWLRTGKR